MSVFFKNIYGNDNIKSMMSSYIVNGNIPHAFIIEGPVGSGKKHIAKSVLAALSCLDPTKEIIPCEKCINCIKIFKDVSPDVILLSSEGKNSIGVELIRELKPHTYVSANELEKKAYVIENADKMTVQAQNALLKILEEPVTDVLYFLLCENSQAMLPTIISRAPVLRTSIVNIKDVYSIIKEKHPEINDDRLQKYAQSSKGIVGTAINFIDNAEAFQYASTLRDRTLLFLSLLTDKKSKYEFISFFTQTTGKLSDSVDLLRRIYSALRDIVLYKDTGREDFDFFYADESILQYEKKIKTKYAKRICLIIEDTIEKLYTNQGTSSAHNIFYDMSLKIYNSKQ